MVTVNPTKVFAVISAVIFLVIVLFFFSGIISFTDDLEKSTASVSCAGENKSTLSKSDCLEKGSPVNGQFYDVPPNKVCCLIEG
ncbi:hypothetical protein GOV09_02515 [Candidatus Woesearchaeota archaeon]|nr:hypothetical protein [Candidatus Woesearchaeota archaeon]